MVTPVARAREVAALQPIGLLPIEILRFVQNPQSPTTSFLLDARLPMPNAEGKFVKYLTVVMYEANDDGSDPSLRPVLFTHIWQFPPLLNALTRGYGPESGIGSAAAGQVIRDISLTRSARPDHIQLVAVGGDDGDDHWTPVGRP